MNQLMRWTLLFAAMMIVMKPGHTFTIGTKNFATGPIVHSTYFMTPNNAAFDVHAKAYLGFFLNNICQANQFSAIYDLGTERLQTGDIVYIDGFKLRSLVGTGFNCATIFYTYQQMAFETFQLFFDGLNYTSSNPGLSEVRII